MGSNIDGSGRFAESQASAPPSRNAGSVIRAARQPRAEPW